MRLLRRGHCQLSGPSCLRATALVEGLSNPRGVPTKLLLLPPPSLLLPLVLGAIHSLVFGLTAFAPLFINPSAFVVFAAAQQTTVNPQNTTIPQTTRAATIEDATQPLYWWVILVAALVSFPILLLSCYFLLMWQQRTLHTYKSKFEDMLKVLGENTRRVQDQVDAAKKKRRLEAEAEAAAAAAGGRGAGGAGGGGGGSSDGGSDDEKDGKRGGGGLLLGGKDGREGSGPSSHTATVEMRALDLTLGGRHTGVGPLGFFDYPANQQNNKGGDGGGNSGGGNDDADEEALRQAEEERRAIREGLVRHGRLAAQQQALSLGVRSAANRHIYRPHHYSRENAVSSSDAARGLTVADEGKGDGLLLGDPSFSSSSQPSRGGGGLSASRPIGGLALRMLGPAPAEWARGGGGGESSSSAANTNGSAQQQQQRTFITSSRPMYVAPSSLAATSTSSDALRQSDSTSLFSPNNGGRASSAGAGGGPLQQQYSSVYGVGGGNPSAAALADPLSLDGIAADAAAAHRALRELRKTGPLRHLDSMI